MELKTNAEIDREIVAEYVQKNLLTDEQSIYNLVRTDRNLAQRAYDWIRNTATRIFGNKQNRQRARLEHAAKIYAKALKETWGTGTTAGSVRMGSDPAAQTDTFEARTASMDEAYRRGELSEEDYDAALDAMEQDEEERLASQMGQYSFSDRRNVAKTPKRKYNGKYSKVFFYENVFPPYGESKSESHERAERWARSENTQSGECRLISYHDEWYRIQAFDDLKYGYQIMAKIAAKDYEREAKYYGTITGYESLQDSLDQDVAQHHGRSDDGDAGYRADHDGSEYGRKNRQIHELGEGEVRRSRSSGDGSGDRAGGRVDRSGSDGSSVIVKQI